MHYTVYSLKLMASEESILLSHMGNGTPKKRNKTLNIGRRTILYETFIYSFSILNLFQT